MPYVAGKRLQIQKPDGTVEWREPGQPVPEAATWRNLAAWIAQKRVVLVPDEAVVRPSAKMAVQPVADPTPLGDEESTPAAPGAAPKVTKTAKAAKAKKAS